jgi:site-specific DNA recombinase
VNKPNVKKLVLLNLPYVFAFYFADKIAAVFRLAPGTEFIDKLTNGFAVFDTAFANPLPSFHPVDLLIGLSAGVLLKLAVYVKGKNRKKFRQGEEYGSARWGKPEDIKPYMDPEFSNNVILTQTEFLTMNSRPKQPKYARNKNILVIGGSGSGKTRFFVKPNLMQMHSSYVVTDPKGTVLVECGKMLEKGGYVIKSLNTINFQKSMHYNPFSYIRSEKDILKLVNTIIVNTKGDGDKSGEDFWVKAEKLYYTALIGYIWYEAPDHEKNFTTLLEMINASEAREDDETFKNPVDVMFDELEARDPDHFAVKQHRKYKLAAGVVCSKRLLNQAVGKSLRTHNLKPKKGAQVMRKNEKITALYERLSRDDFGKDDDQQRESNSISNQKKMLEDYAKANGFTNCVHFTDDGWSGGSFDRPSWKRMIEGIGKGEIAAVLVKDLSRVGRDYLQVGFYTEVMFREKGVRFVAITNGVDSDKRESSEFAPFLNIMNEWYIRDCSRKITSVLRARGMSGKHTSNHCIYGYKKDPNDKDHWIIDEEAAEVVRRIYRMAIEGKGPYEIARILATEKVERPSYYLAQRGMGNHQSNYNAADPYTWRGGTVADILSKQEYMGHTVNFRTYKESYKDKRVKMTPKEDLVIFENTQEAIIDKETWERVQTLRKTIRRTDSIGKANPLTGLMFCADCGAKMYNHRGKAGNARDWAGRPNGKKRPDRDEYNCSRYDLGNQHYDKYCTTHLIRTAVVNELLLEAIKGVCDYALNNEAEFMAQVCSASEDRQEKAARSIRQRKQRNEKRTDELTRLIRKLYEDNVSGRLSDTLFEQMLRDFEAELSDLTEIVSQDQQELERISRETINAEKFLSLVRKYTDFSELTPAMINEFVEKILVHQAQGKGASRIQEIEIFFNFVGKVDIPHKEVELTEEEKAALAEQERRRAKKAEYNRRYMEKKRRQWKEQQEQEQAEQLPLAAEQKGEHIA